MHSVSYSLDKKKYIRDGNNFSTVFTDNKPGLTLGINLLIVFVSSLLLPTTSKIWFIEPIIGSLALCLFILLSVRNVTIKDALLEKDMPQKGKKYETFRYLSSAQRYLSWLSSNYTTLIFFSFLTFIIFAAGQSFQGALSTNIPYIVLLSSMLFMISFIIFYSILDPLLLIETSDLYVDEDSIKISYGIHTEEIKTRKIKDIKSRRFRITLDTENGEKHTFWVHSPDRIKKRLISQQI